MSNDQPRFSELFENYDLHSPVVNEHYDEVIDELHRHCPVARSNDGEGYWVVNRYADVQRCAQDWQTFTSIDGFMPNRPPDMPFWAPVECDPPFHDELRNALNPYFGPKVVAEQEQVVHRLANELIDEFFDDGYVEAMSQFSNALAARVFCTIVAGMSEDEAPFLRSTFQTGMHGAPEERAPAMLRAHEYISKYLAKRKEEPARGDVVDALLSFEPTQLQGAPGRAASFEWEDKVGVLSQLSMAALGTTGSVFGGGIYYLATHADDRRRLRDNPSLLRVAVEEFLRLNASAPLVGRRATADTEVAGTLIRKGDFAMMNYGAASRDPLVSPNPTKTDIERSPNRHLAFGAGTHRCIGSHLARLELRVGIATFLSRIPEFRVPDGFVPRFHTGITRDMIELPIIFDSEVASPTSGTPGAPKSTAAAGTS